MRAAPLEGTTVRDAPFYLPQRDEVAVFEACHRRRTAVMLKGPTGCGKTRLVEYMAWRLGRPLITVACHDDLTAADLVGRWLLRDGGTEWQDGPLARGVRAGAIVYLDEVVEARQDTTVVIHALTDHRRLLPIDRTGEQLEAPTGFQLVISYNPGYQQLLKELKPSTRQRFVAVELALPSPETELAIVVRESGLERGLAHRLVTLATRVRGMGERGLAEVPGTRLLVATASLMAEGVAPATACRTGLIAPLTDDPILASALEELVHLAFA